MMQRMTVSSKDKSKNDKMTSASTKKSAAVVKRGERQATPGAHTNTRSQSRKRPSGGGEELDLSEDELVMVEAEYDQRNAAAVHENGAAPQPKRRRSKVQFQEPMEIPKLEDAERRDSAVDVAIKRKFSM